MKLIPLFALTAALCFYGCGKEEPEPTPAPAPTANPNNAPVFTLVGDDKDTIILNVPFVDPGAIAVDDVNGNITSSIVVTGALNVNLVGDYVKKYNVSDADGHAAPELTRMIHVRNEAEFMVGNYAVVPNCGSTPNANYNNSISVSTTLNRSFVISNMSYNNTNSTLQGLLSASLNSFSVTAAPGNNSTFSANGTLSIPGKWTVSSSAYNGNVGGYYNCSSLMTKQ